MDNQIKVLDIIAHFFSLVTALILSLNYAHKAVPEFPDNLLISPVMGLMGNLPPGYLAAVQSGNMVDYRIEMIKEYHSTHPDASIEEYRNDFIDHGMIIERDKFGVEYFLLLDDRLIGKYVTNDRIQRKIVSMLDQLRLYNIAITCKPENYSEELYAGVLYEMIASNIDIPDFTYDSEETIRRTIKTLNNKYYQYRDSCETTTTSAAVPLPIFYDHY